MGKTIIVSNRLPLRVEKGSKGKLNFIPSEGGLATGLGSVYKGGGNVWVGWPGVYFNKEEKRRLTEERLAEENMKPVFLSKQQIELYYEGFSNSTLWPNFHYFNQYAIYKRTLWEAFVEVNQKFCEVVLEMAKPGDKIWVHDYQLFLLPGMIRAKLPDISIGFFLHIPFPSHEVFRLIPWRKELLNGVLGADLIGFHTYDDMRHFLSAVSRLAFLSNQNGRINVGNRVLEVDAFPMGIDYNKYAEKAASTEVIKNEVEYRTSLGDQKFVLSVDRLDYSKGIPNRLVSFELFLQKYPEFRGKVSLILLVVPSRDQVDTYRELKEEIDLLVGRINGQFSMMKWTPIHYFYRSLPFDKLSAMYRMADVALVTPMRDGMNLVCKEFVASKLDKTGVLILSEMAGASKELSDAILINPNNKHRMADALKEALEMSVEQQQSHMETMQATIKRYNVHHWVDLFLGRLDQVKAAQKEMDTKNADHQVLAAIEEVYNKANSRILFLDYDGTLVGFKSMPELAAPDKKLKTLLEKLAAVKNNRVVIISGRDHETLESWFGDLDIELIAEHGVWMKRKDAEWKLLRQLNLDWKDKIRPILESYVDKTPGSFIEEKHYSIVWHYRKVETGFGELRAREIMSHLKFFAESENLIVLEGNKVLEIKNSEVNKGKAAELWLEDDEYGFVLAVGDDWTDEDTFKAMPRDSYTIKVGPEVSDARYRVNSYKEVRKLLEKLT
ncbi:MAG: bifunctional alpha,alpha-trehalose-phosphate synthase (UDP-forming)/trehalose-phosphatase [Cyclobacteriaceae bacterium]|nr:bifunctional alpha,alpha-trehalose-phosphate synthase (UDP-forming)/trehalose-phosphatase [Cyclobacteriaceae bacterium]